MDSIKNVVSADKPADLTRRLRVEISGLSVETRRQLGLTGGEQEEPEGLGGAVGGWVQDFHMAGRPVQEPHNESETIADRTSPDVGDKAGSLSERRREREVLGVEAAPTMRGGESEPARREERREEAREGPYEAGAPGSRPGRKGNELVAEGNHPSMAGNPTLLRPGRARSGDGETRANQLQELQAAVSHHTARNQQMFGALLQALRDAAQGQAVHRAELDRLASQLRTLAAQNASAGFNRQ